MKRFFITGCLLLGLFISPDVLAVDTGGVDLDKAQRIRGKNVQRSIGHFRQNRRVKRTSVDYRRIQKNLNQKRLDRIKARENKTYDPSAEKKDRKLTINRGGLETGRTRRKQPNFSIRSAIKSTSQTPATRGRNRRTRPGSMDRTYRRQTANNEKAQVRRFTRRISAGDSYKKSKRKQHINSLRNTQK